MQCLKMYEQQLCVLIMTSMLAFVLPCCASCCRWRSYNLYTPARHLQFSEDIQTFVRAF